MSFCLPQLRGHFAATLVQRASCVDAWLAGGAPGGDTV
jgi:hypothetical protein